MENEIRKIIRDLRKFADADNRTARTFNDMAERKNTANEKNFCYYQEYTHNYAADVRRLTAYKLEYALNERIVPVKKNQNKI